MALIVVLAPNLALIGAYCSNFGFHWGSSGVAQIWAPVLAMAMIGALAPIFAFIGDPSAAFAPNLALIRALAQISAFIGDPVGWLKLGPWL